MRLHTEQLQVALHRALANARLIGQIAHAPVRRDSGLTRERGVEQRRDIIVRMSPGSTRLQLIVQARKTMLAKTFAPVGHRRRRHLHTPRRLAHRHAAFRQQDHARTPYQAVRQAA